MHRVKYIIITNNTKSVGDEIRYDVAKGIAHLLFIRDKELFKRLTKVMKGFNQIIKGELK